jgi:hypothetical protein
MMLAHDQEVWLYTVMRRLIDVTSSLLSKDPRFVVAQEISTSVSLGHCVSPSSLQL